MKITVASSYADEIVQTYRSYGINLRQAAQRVFGDRGVPMYVEDVSEEVVRRLDAASPHVVECMIEEAASRPWPSNVKVL